MTLSVAGKSVIRRDLVEKLTGEAKYSANLVKRALEQLLGR